MTERKVGRPKGDPSAVRTLTIGVRVSPGEYEILKMKAKQMGMAPAQWLREAALSKRLPPPPVPEINKSEYASLGRLAGNLNQLARAANIGYKVAVDKKLLIELKEEVRQLRCALIGENKKINDRRD